MTYKAYFSLESVKVIRSDGEDGEYSFRLYYNDQLYSIVNTPDDVSDGSEWSPNSVAYQIGPFDLGEKFSLKLESIEYDGPERGGDVTVSVEKTFGLDDSGLHNIYLKDSDKNELEFRVKISTQSIIFPVSTRENEKGLAGVMLYEDWKYNKEYKPPNKTTHFFVRPASQRFDVGLYDLPVDSTFRVGGRWGGWALYKGIAPNATSSVKVGAGYMVELWDQFGQQGEKITLTFNTPELPNSWNDKVRSIGVFINRGPG